PLVSAPRGSCCLRGLILQMDRGEGRISFLYLACPTLWREVSEISAPWGREAATLLKRRRHPCLSKRSMIYTSLRRPLLIGAIVCAERGANFPLDHRAFLRWMSR